MAQLIGGLGTSHIPAIGNAIHKGLQNEPYWKPLFDGFPPIRQWLIVPGSAGQPRDGNPAACYAMFDLAEQSLTFHRVPYDHDTAARKILDAGLPARLAERLIHGQ